MADVDGGCTGATAALCGDRGIGTAGWEGLEEGGRGVCMHGDDLYEGYSSVHACDDTE